MLRPLAWKYDPVETSILEPISMTVIESASSLALPDIDEEEKQVVKDSIDFFIGQQKKLSSEHRIALAVLDQTLSVPSPIRYSADSAIVHDQILGRTELCSAPRSHAFTGWLVGAWPPDYIPDILNKVKQQANLDSFVEHPDDLDRGLWLEFSTTPTIPEVVTEDPTMIYTQVPGVQLYKFPPRGSEYN